MNPTVRRLALAALLAVGLPAMAQSQQRVDPQHLYDYWILLNHSVDIDVPNSARGVTQPGWVSPLALLGTSTGTFWLSRIQCLYRCCGSILCSDCAATGTPAASSIAKARRRTVGFMATSWGVGVAV